MPLIDVGDVVQGVATLLDDPSQSSIDADYVIPFMNLRWSNLVVNLIMLGLQYSEEQVTILIPAHTKDLSSFMQSGGPLAALMSPKDMQWKLVGTDDMTYADVFSTNELEDLPEETQGIQQYSWQGGTILVTPSGVDVTLRVRFNAMATTLQNLTDDLIRGVGDIIAYRTAEIIYAIRGNPLKADMKAWGDTALDDFCAMSVMRQQTNLNVVTPTHRRHRFFASVNISGR